MRARLIVYVVVFVGIRWTLGRRAMWVAIGLTAGLWALRWLAVWFAHRGFLGGAFGRGRFLYGGLARLCVTRPNRHHHRVSSAACLAGAGDYIAARRKLAELAPAELSEVVRAAWLNNMAYVLARSGDDLDIALAHARKAVALRPWVASFRHTLGLCLLETGAHLEAIHELDRVWRSGDEIEPLLESERCHALGCAWLAQGESDYAADYFLRAARSAPASPWATRAQECVKDRSEAEP